MNMSCSHCDALHWAAKQVGNSRLLEFGICCNHGKVQLPLFPKPPNKLRQLLNGRNPDSQDFCNNIPQYNTALAFTSLGVQVDKTINWCGPGLYIFRMLVLVLWSPWTLGFASEITCSVTLYISLEA
jgi:hypothetical protein